MRPATMEKRSAVSKGIYNNKKKKQLLSPTRNANDKRMHNFFVRKQYSISLFKYSRVDRASWFRFCSTSSLSVEITSKISNNFLIVFPEISEFLFESAVTIAALDAPLLRCFRIRAYEWKLYCVFVCVLFVRMKLQNLLCDHCLRSRYTQTTPSVLLSSCMNE